MSDNKPLTDAELAILAMAGYAPAGGGNLAGDGIIILRFRKDGRLITDTRGGWRAIIADTTRLIAAAPELLAACEAMLEWVDFNYPDDSVQPYPADKLRAAIAKARGKE